MAGVEQPLNPWQGPDGALAITGLLSMAAGTSAATYKTLTCITRRTFRYNAAVTGRRSAPAAAAL